MTDNLAWGIVDAVRAAQHISQFMIFPVIIVSLTIVDAGLTAVGATAIGEMLINHQHLKVLITTHALM